MSRGDAVIVWTCDRCGADVPSGGGMPPEGWLHLYPPQLSASGSVNISYWKDICYDCSGSYKDWWNLRSTKPVPPTPDMTLVDTLTEMVKKREL